MNAGSSPDSTASARNRRDLHRLTLEIGRREPDPRLVLTDRLGDLEPLREQVHECRVDVVDAGPVPVELLVAHGEQKRSATGDATRTSASIGCALRSADDGRYGAPGALLRWRASRPLPRPHRGTGGRRRTRRCRHRACRWGDRRRSSAVERFDPHGVPAAPCRLADRRRLRQREPRRRRGRRRRRLLRPAGADGVDRRAHDRAHARHHQAPARAAGPRHAPGCRVPPPPRRSSSTARRWGWSVSVASPAALPLPLRVSG